MDDPLGTPPQPETQLSATTPVQNQPAQVNAPSPVAPLAPQSFPSGAAKAAGLGAILLKRVIVTLVIAAIAGGASYYVGYRVGYNAGTSVNPSCGGATLCSPQQRGGVLDEPVVYLYPPKAEPVHVQVTYPAGFSYTHPTYNPTSGWQVLATPSGTMTNLADNKQYPYLIWEGNPPPIKFDMSTGFVVPGDQTASFLHKELPTIGLSPTETDAFIAYWQPKMVGNQYNLIHFAGKEYTDYAKLTVSPQPDSELRVLMAFEPLKQPIPITPQTFSGFQRKGFTVVEWGGTELIASQR